MVRDSAALDDVRQSKSLSHKPEEDCRRLYHATIADINFRPSRDDASATKIDHRSVLDLLTDGSSNVFGHQGQQLRWIHLPVNHMSWIEDLFDRLKGLKKDLELEKNDNGKDHDVSTFDAVLRNSSWRGVYRGKRTTDIHARFMVPLAMRYSSSEDDDPDSEDNDLKWQETNTIALYMPYLHWESYDSWKDRQRHIARMKALKHAASEIRCDCAYDIVETTDGQAKHKEAALLHQGLFHASPLHDRRTLDQSYFYNLRNVARHDEDQIVGMHTDNSEHADGKPRKMMMTDQLWMWVVEGKTIVTACPSTDALGLKGGDVAETMFEELPRAVKNGTVKSLRGLMAFIVEHCTGVFHRNDIDEDLAFFQIFADEIGKVKNELEDMLRRFHDLSGSIESLWTKQGVTVEHMSSKLDVLFSIKNEIRLIARIDKIVSDLDKIDFVCGQQEDTGRDLVKCCKSSRSLTAMHETLKSRRGAWAGMAASIKETRASLQSLLDLKQRQATVGEARSVRYQIELASSQGQSIMLLTVITVIFLPVSMLATVFGMNAKELVGKDGGKISLKAISAVVVPTTLTLITCTLALAFSKQSKDMTVSFWRRLRDILVRSKAEEAGHVQFLSTKV